MKNVPMTEVHPVPGDMGARPRARAWLAVLCLWACASGCGPAEPSIEPQEWDSQTQELASINGLSSNGLSSNGLSSNGLSSNGLSSNGLSSQAFRDWFVQDPAAANMLMTYVIRCAVPAGQTRSFTHPQTQQTYTWTGGLGLAPDWSKGSPPNYAEQQLVTACLLAHVNRYGDHVTISVLGTNAWGTPIPVTPSELGKYNIREACFFGNIFTPNSLFFGVDRQIDDEGRYLTRACGAMGSGSSLTSQCAPLRFVGSCAQRCTPNPQGLSYTNCTFNGVSYKPLTTRMSTADYQRLFPESGEDEDDGD